MGLQPGVRGAVSSSKTRHQPVEEVERRPHVLSVAKGEELERSLEEEEPAEDLLGTKGCSPGA
tara:strand:- start:368 stop:556 length:189 start_codon:yes stop_codon:yes gene_type:complete